MSDDWQRNWINERIEECKRVYEESRADIETAVAELDGLVSRAERLQRIASEAREDVACQIHELDQALAELLRYFGSLLDGTWRPTPEEPFPHPPDPDDLRDWPKYRAKEVLEQMQFELRAEDALCQNPACGKPFRTIPYGRERLYCSDKCRVQAFRLRQQSDGVTPKAAEEPCSEDQPQP